MISPRQRFLKEPYASKVQDFIVTDEFQSALSYALADMTWVGGITTEQLSGAKLLIRHLCEIGEPFAIEEIFQQPQLTQPDPDYMRRLKDPAKKSK
jgi:hypothetical protein